MYFYHQCKILLSLWFLIVSCHLCICKKKELAPISSPKSWRFDLKSRPPKWLKWLKWQSKSKGQETSRFKWASKYLIVFFGWFLFSCQTDSKPKCCGGTTHKKKNIARYLQKHVPRDWRVWLHVWRSSLGSSWANEGILRDFPKPKPPFGVDLGWGRYSFAQDVRVQYLRGEATNIWAPSLSPTSEDSKYHMITRIIA